MLLKGYCDNVFVSNNKLKAPLSVIVFNRQNIIKYFFYLVNKVFGPLCKFIYDCFMVIEVSQHTYKEDNLLIYHTN